MRTLGVVVKMKYHHVVAKWTVEGGADHTARMMRFDGIVILAEGNLVHVINEKDGSISTMKLVITLKGIVHPMTYVNKLLAFS